MDSRTDNELASNCFAISPNHRMVHLRATAECKADHICFIKSEEEKALICDKNGECILLH